MQSAVKLKKRKIFKYNPKKRLSRSRFGNLTVLICLALFSAFMILPMIYAVVQSLKPMEEIFAFPPKFYVRNPTLDNFKQMFKLANNLTVPFLRYLSNSLFVAVVTTALYVVVASLAAYPLAKAKYKGVRIISRLIVVAMLFRGEVTAIPRYIIIAKLGMIDTYWSIIIPALSATMGVYLVQQFILTAVPDSTLEAARIDGAGEYRIFFSIVLPSIKPAILTMIIFTFQGIWNDTGTNFIFSESLKQLPAVLSSISTGGLARSGASAAVSVVLMIPPILVFLYSQSSIMDTMSHSGLK